MVCFPIQLFAGSKATIVSNDSIPFLMEELGNCSFKYNFSIYRIYKLANSSYNDYVLLTEHPYSTTGKVVLNDSVQAFCIRIVNGKCVQRWVLKDFIIKNPNNDIAESTIWFWSKYIQIKDIDCDGETEFTIVYGTKGLNGIDDGRLKILVYYKGRKYAIRHQNGVLDFERQTQIDSLFYSLPESIQDSTIHLIERIIQDGNAILSYGWENAIENKKVIIMEENQEPPPKKKEKKNQNGQHILQQR
jgi:hypothetical protein